jgi:hypothetical protein
MICGGPREGQKRDTCSDRCRAALSRRRRAALWETKLAELRAERDWLRAKLEAIEWISRAPVARSRSG